MMWWKVPRAVLKRCGRAPSVFLPGKDGFSEHGGHSHRKGGSHGGHGEQREPVGEPGSLWTGSALRSPLLSPARSLLERRCGEELTLAGWGLAVWSLEEVAVSKKAVCEGGRAEERTGGRRRGKGRGEGERGSTCSP